MLEMGVADDQLHASLQTEDAGSRGQSGSGAPTGEADALDSFLGSLGSQSRI